MACTGVHGANRLASNSLLEAIVFSKRIIEKAGNKNKLIRLVSNKGKVKTYSLREKPLKKRIPAASLTGLQQLLWDNVGIIRNKEGLTKAAGLLAVWQQALSPPADHTGYELYNLILTGRLMTEAAYIRKESRGAHFRTDFPRSSPRWQKHIIWRK